MAMHSANRLRFKIVTSFAIAALGLIAMLRLASEMPLSSAILPFVILGVLVTAGLWRGFIFLQTLRGPSKT